MDTKHSEKNSPSQLKEVLNDNDTAIIILEGELISKQAIISQLIDTFDIRARVAKNDYPVNSKINTKILYKGNEFNVRVLYNPDLISGARAGHFERILNPVFILGKDSIEFLTLDTVQVYGYDQIEQIVDRLITELKNERIYPPYIIKPFRSLRLGYFLLNFRKSLEQQSKFTSLRDLSEFGPTFSASEIKSDLKSPLGKEIISYLKNKYPIDILIDLNSPEYPVMMRP